MKSEEVLGSESALDSFEEVTDFYFWIELMRAIEISLVYTSCKPAVEYY